MTHLRWRGTCPVWLCLHGPPEGQSARERLLKDTLLDSKLYESNLLKVDYQQAAQIQGRLQSVWWWPWLCCSLLDRPPSSNASEPELVSRCPEIHLLRRSDSLFWISGCLDVLRKWFQMFHICWDLEPLSSRSHWGGARGLRG